jgi:hypothetical protein
MAHNLQLARDADRSAPASRRPVLPAVADDEKVWAAGGRITRMHGLDALVPEA